VASDLGVTLTTVLYNSQDSLARFASQLAPAVRDGTITLVAVDNASPDGSAAEIKALIPECRLVVNLQNVGYAGGCNAAWPHVSTPYWMLLNPDVELDIDALGRLVRWMDRHPDVAAASPRLIDPAGDEFSVARQPDSLWLVLVELARLHKLLPPRLRARWLFPGRTFTPDAFKGWVPGAAMIVRARAVQDVGLLDASIFMYGEDVDWCRRMVAANWRVGFCQDVVLTHGGGTSATATWGRTEHIAREVHGHLSATRKAHGAIYVRLISAASAALFFSVATARAGHADAGARSVRWRARCYSLAALAGADALVGSPDRQL
jgi:GT2 family glycosyltransferase